MNKKRKIKGQIAVEGLPYLIAGLIAILVIGLVIFVAFGGASWLLEFFKNLLG